MTTRLDSANRIPGNRVGKALADLQVAVRANPSLVVIGVGSGGWLHRILDPALDLGAGAAKSHAIHVERSVLGSPLIGTTARLWRATH